MPNVVIYMSDQHNPFFSAVYGHEDIKTPNMARLASMGTTFENAYCPSPLCMPSRSSFMAGRPVHQIQVYNNCNIVNFDYPSYGSVLKSQGVYTTYIGKTHVYNHPSKLGFSEMIRPLDAESPGDTYMVRTPLTIRKGAATRARQYGPKEDAFREDQCCIDRAVEWLTERAPTIGRPWTLTVNTSAPHFPHYVTQELWDMYADSGDLPKYGLECPSANHPYAKDLRVHFETDLFSEEQIRGLRRGYLGCITWVDNALGRLLDTLEKSRCLDETVIVYTSDHGEMLGKFGMWWKCSLYEDSVRIPLIVAGPGFKRGARVKTPVTLHDLQASIFKALGKIRPHGWWGTALQDIPENDPSRAAFAEYHGHGVHSGAFMIRRGKWKLIYNMDAPHQLFDLESDPEELDNVADTEKEIFNELVDELRSICSPEEENKRAHQFERKQVKALREKGYPLMINVPVTLKTKEAR